MMKKINYKRYILIVFCALLFVGLSVLILENYEHRDNKSIDIEINQISFSRKEDVENYYQAENDMTVDFKNALFNSKDYSIIKYVFTAASKERAIVKKAVFTSNDLLIVYNNKNYNICESPVCLEKNIECEFVAYILVDNNSIPNAMNQNEIKNYIASNIDVQLK